MSDHNCELPKYTERLRVSYSMKKVKKYTFGERFKCMFNISMNTPKSRLYLDSVAAAFAEGRRPSGFQYWWIIHPFSRWSFYWEIVMTVVFMISFLTIPFLISYVVLSHDDILMDKVNIVIYVFCWVDIIINCNTGYYDRKLANVELQPGKIMIQYLKTFLIPDILSSLPWDHITLPWRCVPGVKVERAVVLVNLLPLLKLSRYRYVNRQFFDFFMYLQVMHLYYELFSTLMLAFYILFWFSCLSYLIPALFVHMTGIAPESSRITGLEQKSIRFRFLHSLFMVVEKFSANGFGMEQSTSEGHLILSSVLMLAGRLLDCYIVVMLIQIKAGAKQSKSKFHEIMNQVIAYTIQKQLPPHMKNRLLTYYQHRFRYSYFREKTILVNLSGGTDNLDFCVVDGESQSLKKSVIPEQLRQEIAFQSNHRLVENVAIFKTLPKYILRSIVKNLKFELYLPNDVIVKAGPTGKEICHLDDGAHFGEVALLVPDQRRVASVIAIEVCEVYRLDRKDFRKSVAVHSELFAKIERIATQRIQRAMDIEEQHKRYLLRNSSYDERRRTLM
ncbi:PREDICTED: LOW QUALITY PROTEIN: potassium/sodium hyperpolarization-activated cyclic nucleotide-gated channel 4-like [Dufourea novaeangliae]|uniref:LOW QUALITY PROTEIN: potassium/sodium hyperpolarization-activated cyclic nucleotide-gated channel 4-like n=1 Tax=Dufourea novaeangliae TaxID=178035 RepID=UPI0007673FC9|nr:PREDICTED: LOW QUALITY PROTEIN: potassium/sodium hyperpolarization-activated cyclic nucleotide-gated channel 4-like [Dufourea novaeangliae]